MMENKNMNTVHKIKATDLIENTYDDYSDDYSEDDDDVSSSSLSNNVYNIIIYKEKKRNNKCFTTPSSSGFRNFNSFHQNKDSDIFINNGKTYQKENLSSNILFKGSSNKFKGSSYKRRLLSKFNQASNFFIFIIYIVVIN